MEFQNYGPNGMAYRLDIGCLSAQRRRGYFGRLLQLFQKRSILDVPQTNTIEMSIVENIQRQAEGLVKIGAAATLFLIVFSNIYGYTFYEQFYLSIYDYLKPVDVITMFLPYCFIWLTIFAFVLGMVYLPFIHVYHWVIRALYKNVSPFRLVAKKFRFKLRVLMLAIFILMICSIFFRHTVIQTEKQNRDFIISLFCFSAGFTLLFILLVSFTYRKTIKNYKLFLICAFLTFYSINALGLGIYQSNYIKIANDMPTVMRFKFKDRVIITSDTLRFVGSPGDNIIFYGTSKHLLIFKKSDLSDDPIEIEIKDKRKVAH